MTLEEVIQVASMCVKGEDSTCSIKGCPLYNRDDCRRHLFGCAVTYLSMYRAGVSLGGSSPLGNSPPLNPSPDLIGGIMGHYKKPLVTISISEMEETE